MDTPCKSCGAKVIWCVTVNGKKMPVDTEPVHNGNILLRRRGDKTMALYLSKEAQPRGDEHRYVSHFATCPHAKSHRRK